MMANRYGSGIEFPGSRWDWQAQIPLTRSTAKIEKDDNGIIMTDTLTRSALVKGDRSSAFVYTHHDSAEPAGLEPCQTSPGKSGVEFIPANKALREKNEHRRHAVSTQGRKTQSRCYRPEAIFL
jgi:hypothetical protein